ncbi:hypothetical protein CDD81_3564 [Ophiocordyceps australis]|uniref:Extracellular mutant protein 11 C-terminal domain-containing protein n=1 Tax=Ophiocordyceps australis TaxID=1399860 RepID=A0A2C5X771_9HYPO|nr:hypothetical protein CDD81_3564 [Ophiocordyceps australis]
MPSWKEKTGRLQAFARHKSESQNTAPASGPEPQDEAAPERPASVNGVAEPSRHQLAEAARISVPAAASRNGHREQQQQQQQQQQQPEQEQPQSLSLEQEDDLPAKPYTPPPNLVAPIESPPRLHNDNGSVHGRDDLFCGSQLGDDFMKSVISTPKNEAQEAEQVTPTVRQRSARPAEPRLAEPRPAEPRPPGSRGSHTKPNLPIFEIDKNLMMTMLPRNQGRTSSVHVMDGFQQDVLRENNNSKNYTSIINSHNSRSAAAAAAAQPKLPLREVRIKRLPAPAQSPVRQTRRASVSFSPGHHRSRKEHRSEGRAQEAATYDDGSGEEAEVIHEYKKAEKMPEPRRGRDQRRLVETGSMAAPATSQRPHGDRKRRRGSFDYDDKLLNTMTYSDLDEEPFDLDPAKAVAQKGPDSAAKLPLKLEQYRQQGRKEQLQLFSKMSLDEWETSGDWFVDQFTKIMKKLRDARRNKRRAMRAFEDEAARREEAVRLRLESMDRRLVKMKQDGQRVVAGAL